MRRLAEPRRAPSNLSETLHQQITMYALAAGAAGVSLLASAQCSEAKIVYTPTHHILTNGTLPIPVDGTHDFALSDKFYIITGSWSTQLLNINAAARGSVVGSKGSAAALKRGAVIGPKDKFQTGKVLMAGGFCETQISSSRVFGPFANTTQRYLGLKFKLNGKVHYGWARFATVKAFACNGGPAVSATLTGYAYETMPGKSIKAGQIKEAAEEPMNEDFGSLASVVSPMHTPQPATLSMLAMGSPALSIWRRERPTVSAQ
jgi:hypothetical protein